MAPVRTKKRRAASPARAEVDARFEQLSGFHAAKEWRKLAELTEALHSEGLLKDDEHKGWFCRAAVHLDAPSDSTLALVSRLADELIATKGDHVDALLGQSVVAAKAGDGKLSGDKALEALKAANYKDDEAVKLLSASQSKQGHAPEAKDPYATLHVAATAPEAVIKAAYESHGQPEGSAEAKAAEEAYAVLSDKDKRATHDEQAKRRKTGGTGFDIEGGSELLAQLGRALGLKFPDGFVFPPSGRFQGGFGGGFEFTWGDQSPVKEEAVVPAKDEAVVDA